MFFSIAASQCAITLVTCHFPSGCASQTFALLLLSIGRRHWVRWRTTKRKLPEALFRRTFLVQASCNTKFVLLFRSKSTKGLVTTNIAYPKIQNLILNLFFNKKHLLHLLQTNMPDYPLILLVLTVLGLVNPVYPQQGVPNVSVKPDKAILLPKDDSVQLTCSPQNIPDDPYNVTVFTSQNTVIYNSSDPNQRGKQNVFYLFLIINKTPFLHKSRKHEDSQSDVYHPLQSPKWHLRRKLPHKQHLLKDQHDHPAHQLRHPLSQRLPGK